MFDIADMRNDRDFVHQRGIEANIGRFYSWFLASERVGDRLRRNVRNADRESQGIALRALGIVRKRA